ncbi:MAG: prepilin-type N-terminal cleavage/methylation domain-containing protein [Gammaproteobacteria bacterium]|nr:prepilin-type N-terminal cleavage/methylation domain-containing protein [Gammaproteobacteria bacterium]MBU0773391.1 prepilin-type N-terminal cleavage/methylation domain-containing protein [Gammaproteobacteria bacterium]MBU0857405.1 prepilin-type N-terminal cleavage/methylation domain-containing protein [Gammaproteobacteria bacterium]MBU1846868.1 prepilin-type N-terminal cleavage/methylation domain-containing protein [Gammaproteobacteria bacterium]
MRIKSSTQRGVSLIEVMVTLAIGLVVSIAAIAMVISNRSAYKSTEALSRIQESTRVAFEIMSRDLRAAGVNSCSGGTRVLNLLADPTTRWWSDWTGGLRGFDADGVSGAAAIGSGVGERVAGTDLIEVMHGGTSALTVSGHNSSNAEATVNGVALPAYSLALQQPSGLSAGDLAIVCDFESTALFQVSAVNETNNSIQHAVVADKVPGNCSSGLAYRTPVTCDGGEGSIKLFAPGAQVMRLEAAAWYVGNNGRNGPGSSPTSLYRVGPSASAGGSVVLPLVPEEIVEGVTNMQVRYMLDGEADYRTADSITGVGWRNIIGVEIALDIEAPESGTSTAAAGARLTRTLRHVVNLRNRVL